MIPVIRRAARSSLVTKRQIALGQYFTPMWVARLMAAMCETNGRSVRVLDPGAGAGTLFAAFAARILARGAGGVRSFSITAFELDPALRPFLERSVRAVRRASEACRVPCDIELRQEDFVEWGTRCELGDLCWEARRFDAAILNPPYKKLNAGVRPAKDGSTGWGSRPRISTRHSSDSRLARSARAVSS